MLSFLIGRGLAPSKLNHAECNALLVGDCELKLTIEER